MSFGTRFKELRLKKELNQQELADDFNNIYGHTFSKSSISQYENDKRSPETEALKNFAKYFDVSIDYLLDVEDNQCEVESNDSLYIPDNFLNAVSKYFNDTDICREKKDELFKELSKMYFDSLK